jgi:hypothetical protein
MADLECFFEKNGLGPLGIKETKVQIQPHKRGAWEVEPT